ncbi:MAG: GNAT family N-acetyltransferase [Pyrinomonadaceae bacterium]
MDDSITIRKAIKSDADAIAQFNSAMALETEAKKLDSAKISNGVAAVFDDTKLGFYLVAETNEKEVVGCLMVTNEWSDWRNGWFWWIQSVYILPAHRGKHLYSRMYRSVKELAEVNENVCGFRLYVEKENFHAQEVYKKCGMLETDYLMFEEKK